ncbi:hypothetical protein MKW94_021562 [Papaver nudicaule]|uniref:Homologous recombination OB-fold protein OB-fold domain-containing protein n=1 Tax=Papaver nudicaule TaxID=74823 RepID=A0AA41RP59_PAPNU|nr:hypothetical protein [Papaver nudicaule]
MDMDEAWEDLDVDDSDLVSFLRPSSTILPCKRPLPLPLSQNPNKTKTNTIFPSLEPCSQSRTLESQRKTLTQKRADLPSTSNRRLIPGPAGILQATMNRRAAARDSSRIQIPTQEFIRRMNGEEDEGENDPDFKRNPWVCAVEFGMGFEKGITNLGSIKTTKRVSLVIAIVKSCKPSGLGDLSLTLKDPTGNIGANIHRKVMESEYGNDIAVGCVLILKEVVAFSPSRTGHYLNITLPNLVKVISKDYSGPPTKGFLVSHVNSACPIGECNNKTRSEMAEKVSFVRLGSPERLTSEVPRRHTNKEMLKDDDNNRRQLEESRAARWLSHRGSSSEPAAEIGTQLMEHSVTKQATQLTVRGGDTEDEECIMDVDDNCFNGRAPLENFNCTSNTLQHVSTSKKFFDHPNKGKGVPKMPTASLPEWTDEQLDELFSAYSDDGNTFLL